MTESKFERWAKSGDHSPGRLCRRTGVHTIFESSSYAICRHIWRDIARSGSIEWNKGTGTVVVMLTLPTQYKSGSPWERPMLQAQESILRRIGKVLRAQDDATTHEPVPTRWVDLIHYLDEQERRCAERRQPEAERLISRPSRKI
jgi:hypothetical protein